MPFLTNQSSRLFVSSIRYLFRDEFITAGTAPLSSPRTCEPGPGTLTLTQTDGQFSIAAGRFVFAAQATAGYGEQGFYGQKAGGGGGFARATGRTYRCKLKQDTTLNCYFRLHPSTDLGASNVTEGFVFGGSGGVDSRVCVSNVSFPNMFAIQAGIEYELMIVLRSAGSFYLIRGGAYPYWTVLWIDAATTAATVYPQFSNSLSVGSFDYLHMLDLGGQWANDYGIVTQRLAGARAEGNTFTHENDSIIEFAATTLPSAGNLEMRFRVQDANNYLQLTIGTTGTLTLNSVVAGTPTLKGSTATIVSNGHRIVVISDNYTIKVYSNNVLRFSSTSAGDFANQTSGVLQSLGTGGAVSDLITWPRFLIGASTLGTFTYSSSIEA